MLVKEWMSKRVISIEASETLSEAINTLKRNKIRRLPVLEKGKLVGIVSDRDLKEAAPSKATSLDIWEVHYLMSKIKVKDVMTARPLTISADMTIERAAILMHDKKIGGLPVVDSTGTLIGILTENDIFKALIDITGARVSGSRVSLILPDMPGSIKTVCDDMRKYDFKCISILTTKQGVADGQRKVIIRFEAEANKIDKILSELKANYSNVNFTKDF